MRRHEETTMSTLFLISVPLFPHVRIYTDYRMLDSNYILFLVPYSLFLVMCLDPYSCFIMSLNLIKLLFLFLTMTIASGGYLIHFSTGHLSTLFKSLFAYGKHSCDTELKIHIIGCTNKVPKRWFTHFYRVAVLITSITLILTVYRYFYNGEIPDVVHFVLNHALGSFRKPLVSSESTMVAIILLHIQCCKRFYETHYVSVFSDAKMNVCHYIAGFIHYIGTAISIIGESYGFVKGSTCHLHWSRFNAVHFMCSIIFLLASYEQLKTNFILANLRKDDRGVVVTKTYKIPYGRLFDCISAPLQFTEIVMYLMLTIILWGNSTFNYIFIWVLVNQIETAVATHRWAKTKFNDYPNHRRICIPFVI